DISLRPRHVLGQRRALGILAVAELEIGPEPAGTQRHVLPGLRILAEHLRARILTFLAALAEAAGIFALGIIGAGDEGAELAAAQPQPSVAADRAEARVRAVAFVR